MADATVKIWVDASGPLFDGQAEQAIRDWMDAVKKEVGELGVRKLDTFDMDKTGRATGRYQSEVRYEVVGRYNDVLISDPVVYGPWLEGVSERNRSTRFKGYHLWRKTRQYLRDSAQDVAEQKFKEYADRMGAQP